MTHNHQRINTCDCDDRIIYPFTQDTLKYAGNAWHDMTKARFQKSEPYLLTQPFILYHQFVCDMSQNVPPKLLWNWKTILMICGGSSLCIFVTMSHTLLQQLSVLIGVIVEYNCKLMIYHLHPLFSWYIIFIKQLPHIYFNIRIIESDSKGVQQLLQIS